MDSGRSVGWHTDSCYCGYWGSVKAVKIFNVVIMLALTTVTGCATLNQTRYIVEVESTASSAASDNLTYILVPGNRDVSWGDPQFQEYLVYVMRALNARGYVAASSTEKADVAIAIAYGVRISSYEISGAQEEVYSFSFPSLQGPDSPVSVNKPIDISLGSSGSSSPRDSKVKYLRYALIGGYGFDPHELENQPAQLWKTTITSTGLSKDLDKIFPVLVSAGIPYLGRETTKRVKVTLHESDVVIRDVQGEGIEKNNID